ncbi:23S rRNA (pseudouridine(1915)-N(3))-methyltransferase RlmH [Gammaproteobacteria bacterium]|jgi:23S rRNA (pseudouridine1915-N3)-methyltransferase|nr:23S rRNA (pseudouridine(1915)-N(3))-methyltransferase RlmH [Gammaproteobacteria bacterium]MDB4252694.1 23S rRNA (pseudouridine(1915)-N(3))-methyltransferase RlmH [Gammaproteobacteria bacterium]MDC1191277.1 23S rRNA (pseudouridine(1915)-N(3))-methyltransferase RlmH [Gammaproteobacteria bacterium]|tara:strand:+ start:10941 stop:11405 length:465 start_codon:yes stop_codon:yes gene_type:complete
MRCNIISVGHKPSKWEKEGITFYTKQLPKNFTINYIDIKGKQHPKMSKEEILKLEENLILDKISSDDRVVVCDMSGKSLSSIAFSKFLNKSLNSNKNISFIIGGSFGLSQNILEKADMIFSVSSLTFPHRLFKIILIEQIYRSFSIFNNQPYHK